MARKKNTGESRQVQNKRRRGKTSQDRIIKEAQEARRVADEAKRVAEAADIVARALEDESSGTRGRIPDAPATDLATGDRPLLDQQRRPDEADADRRQDEGRDPRHLHRALRCAGEGRGRDLDRRPGQHLRTAGPEGPEGQARGQAPSEQEVDGLPHR